MRKQREIELGAVTADQPPSVRRSIVRRNLVILFFVALVALSPALAGCYHNDTADDEPTPTDTGGDGGNGNGDGY